MDAAVKQEFKEHVLPREWEMRGGRAGGGSEFVWTGSGREAFCVCIECPRVEWCGVGSESDMGYAVMSYILCAGYVLVCMD